MAPKVLDDDGRAGPAVGEPEQIITPPSHQRITKRQRHLEAIAEAEDRVHQTAIGILEATLDFHLVEPDQVMPPEEWVEMYGEKAAIQRLRVAKAGWMPAGKAPVALRIAPAVVVGIAKARGQQAASRQVVEVNARIALPAPTSAEHPGPVEYPTKEID